MQQLFALLLFSYLRALAGDLAVLQGEIEQHADELVARAPRLLSEFVDVVERIDFDADGENAVAIIAA